MSMEQLKENAMVEWNQPLSHAIATTTRYKELMDIHYPASENHLRKSGGLSVQEIRRAVWAGRSTSDKIHLITGAEVMLRIEYERMRKELDWLKARLKGES